MHITLSGYGLTVNLHLVTNKDYVLQNAAIHQCHRIRLMWRSLREPTTNSRLGEYNITKLQGEQKDKEKTSGLTIYIAGESAT
jgi:hypothetical protein